MLSCREVSHLLSQAQERRLDLGERLRLRLHLAMCSACSQFARQLDFLRRACRCYAHLPSRDEPHDQSKSR